MNVIYLITHEERFKNQTPPYYYIGSKKNWKGEGTYFGSSRHPKLKYADKTKLKFEVLLYWDECTSPFLLERELEVQRHFDVVANPEYFNLAYACTTLYNGTTIERRVDAFKRTANSVAPCGKKFSEIWSEKAQEALGWDVPDEAGLTYRQKVADAKKSWMLSVADDTGKTIAQKIQEKTRATNLKVKESGKTGYQEQGEKLSQYLQSIDPVTGRKRSELRKGNNKPIELIGVCFYRMKDAERFFGISDTGILAIKDNKVTKRLYKKILKVLDKELVDRYIEVNETKSCNPVSICGKTFSSKLNARTTIGMAQSAFENLVLRNKLTNKVKRTLISYFGVEVFELHFKNNSVVR